MFQPYKVWSLFDMLRFYAAKFMAISDLLSRISQTLDVWKAGGKGRSLTLNLPATIKEDADRLCNDLPEMGLTMSAKCAFRFKKIINSEKIDADKLNIIANELIQRIIDELEEHSLFMLSAQKAIYFNPDNPIWGKEIQDKFLDMIEDIEEANNCYALGRNTASVFHLMRVMEKAVQKIATKLGLFITSICDKEWQLIINDIRGQLKSLYPKHSDSNRIKYEATLAHLETIKIAWRNPTMHPKATYTDEEAKAILSAVEIFVKDLTKIL